MDPFETNSFGATTAKERGGALETTALAVLTFALCVAIRPEEPMSVEGAFAWPLLAVMLTALRYGFPLALFSAGVLHAAAWLYSSSTGHGIWPLPLAYSTAFALVAVICGEFRESWGRRLGVVERSNAYRQARLDEFSQTYHVLKLSHDRLEQDNAGNQTSLRSALLTVRNLFSCNADLADNGQAVLDLYRRFSAVVSGALFSLEKPTAAETCSIEDFKCIANIGTARDDLLDDLLVHQAIATRMIASINPGNPEAMAGRNDDDPFIAVPLVDSFGTLRGMLVVTELPFFSYTERTLQLMAILAGQIADFSRDRHTLPQGLEAESATFISETIRSLEYAREYHLPTMLMALSFDDQTLAPACLDTIARQCRGLDRLLPTGDVGDRSALLIMPLTGENEFEQFLTRFDRYLIDAHMCGSKDLGIRTEYLQIDNTTAIGHVRDFISSRTGDGILAEAFPEDPTEDLHAA